METMYPCEIVINLEILQYLVGFLSWEDLNINYSDFSDMIPDYIDSENIDEFLSNFYHNNFQYICEQIEYYDCEYNHCYYNFIFKYDGDYYEIPYVSKQDEPYAMICDDIKVLSDCKKCKPELVIKYSSI